MEFKTIDELVDIKDKIVLLRADLNVPIKDGDVSDTTRIEKVKPTIESLIKKGAKILVMSHMGRPKGEVVPELSLEMILPSLKTIWDVDVQFVNDCIGETVHNQVAKMTAGDICLLENVRFHPEEEENNPEFTKKLAEIADFYVNDAFSVSHRAHSSSEGLGHVLPGYAGLFLHDEVMALTNSLESPKKPMMAIVGGSKVSTKLELLENLSQKSDHLVIGGAMANTFLKAQGKEVGKSLSEDDMIDTAKEIMAKASQNNCEIILPVDCVTADKLEEGVQTFTCDIEHIPAENMILDVGHKTVDIIDGALQKSHTVIWNGPLGVFEISPFDEGTSKLAQLVAKYTQSGQIMSVAGGGDTIAALNKAGTVDDFTYVSAAGGAFLEWMEGKLLPGIKVLIER